MKPKLTYQGITYSYIEIDGEIIVYEIKDKDGIVLFEDDDIFDEEMKQQLEEEFARYEATLDGEELKIWKGEKQ
ncbi:MAG: hypothetical protein JW682_00470 [Campylobacterales bacterium]|nr:hypothetical protein [Campylobacterales bacterium]HEO97878.1 hypothetical protein [Campylobacterota bacterium]